MDENVVTLTSRVPELSVSCVYLFLTPVLRKVGQRWGTVQAPVATRFICSYDASNSEMTMLETFLANLHDFQPNLVLISGLHMLDGQGPNFFEARLDALVAGLNKVDRGIPVHLEFASMVDRNFMRAILEKVSLAHQQILHAV